MTIAIALMTLFLCGVLSIVFMGRTNNPGLETLLFTAFTFFLILLLVLTYSALEATFR